MDNLSAVFFINWLGNVEQEDKSLNSVNRKKIHDRD